MVYGERIEIITTSGSVIVITITTTPHFLTVKRECLIAITC
jgi:hypothetical protein